MTRSVNLPGRRADIRDRATTVAMHMLLRALAQPWHRTPSTRRTRRFIARGCRAGRRRGCSRRSTRRRPCASSWPRGRARRCGRRCGRARGPAQDAKLRLLAPETMHVTLCFLGARPVAEIERAGGGARAVRGPRGGRAVAGRAAVAAAARPALAGARDRRRRRLARAPAAGDRRGVRAGDRMGARPQALSRARDGGADRARQASRRAAEQAAARAGAGPGGQRRRRGEADAREPFLPPTPQLSFTPGAVVLYRSWLEPQGASYEALATRELPG